MDLGYDTGFQQPIGGGYGTVFQQPFGGGDVEVRPMQQSDGEFGGSMQVEAFRSKFEHAAGRENMRAVSNGMAREMSTRPPDGYLDQFIAWYRGERAGYMSLKFNGSRKREGDSSFPGLGCWAGMRLWFMDCVLSADSEIPKDVCYLEVLAVSANFRGKGIGKILLDRADSEARERGCKTIYLAVAHDNRAKNLYERHGYRVVETHESCCLGCASGVDKFFKMEKML